jgi:hypothetical protein
MTVISSCSDLTRQQINFGFPGQTPARLNFGLSDRINFFSCRSAAASLGQS